jgi:hypothetical protein
VGTGDGGSVEIVVAVVALFLFVAGVFAVLSTLYHGILEDTKLPSPVVHPGINSSTGSVTVSLCVFDSSLSTQFKLAE